MSFEQSNPYLAPPATISHRTERGVLLTNIVIGVCTVLAAAMFVGQQIASVRFDGYGFVGSDLPLHTRLFLNPLAVCVLFVCVPPVGVARSWSDYRWRVAVCILALMFMFFYISLFWFSMYLPDMVIRDRMGI